MPLILHLSDLHLVSRAESPPLDDHKFGLIPANTRRTHYDALSLTLERLSERLLEQGKRLDAVVVTGDVSDKNDQGGYEAFLHLLERLGSIHPGAGRVVVVPGNHDVGRGLVPTDPSRYELFVAFIRGAGFVTPLLSSIDTSEATSDTSKHLVSLDDIQIIPVDSAAYSQVRIDVGIDGETWELIESALVGKPKELAALRNLKIVDAVRVDDRQLEALRQLLTSSTPKGVHPVRLVVLHHHLLPVSLAEELKPFESMTNLALLRQFLRDQNVSLVLHGHKHTEFSYVDFVPSFSSDSESSWPLRVISGASGSSGDFKRDDVCRLVEIDVASEAVTVQAVGPALYGTNLAIGAAQRFSFSRVGSARVSATDGCVVIEGDSVGSVYNKLLAKIGAQDREVDNVVCRIKNTPTIEIIADLYPGLPTRTSSEDNNVSKIEEFREVVTWWQYPTAPVSPLDSPSFTHGSRIRRYDGHLDQVEAVISALGANPETSRAIIVLLSPEADKISNLDIQFPSFCLVQFKVEKGSHSIAPRLSCSAYFRKQEVKYWWLVNLAELSELQRQICGALQQREPKKFREIVPGSITTIASRAHAGRGAPKVQVPRVDRYYSLARERLFAMVNALVWREMPNRLQFAGEWRRVFEELVPPEQPDKDGTPIAREGLDYLRDQIGCCLNDGELKAKEPLSTLHRALERLLGENERFAGVQQNAQLTDQVYAQWRAAARECITTIINCTDECFVQ